MNTHERWNYIKNNREIIEQYMAQHDEESKNRKLVNFLENKEQKCCTSTTHGICQKIALFWTKN